MNFIEEIGEFLGAPNESFRFSVCGKQGGYFEGVKSILTFGSERIVLQIKNAQIAVTGAKLSIKKYSLGDVAIKGEISAVEIL